MLQTAHAIQFKVHSQGSDYCSLSSFKVEVNCLLSVMDPGFPIGGTNPLTCILFGKNMKQNWILLGRLVASSINDSMTRTPCHAGETVAVRVKESSHDDW